MTFHFPFICGTFVWSFHITSHIMREFCFLNGPVLSPSSHCQTRDFKLKIKYSIICGILLALAYQEKSVHATSKKGENTYRLQFPAGGVPIIDFLNEQMSANERRKAGYRTPYMNILTKSWFLFRMVSCTISTD